MDLEGIMFIVPKSNRFVKNMILIFLFRPWINLESQQRKEPVISQNNLKHLMSHSMQVKRKKLLVLVGTVRKFLNSLLMIVLLKLQKQSPQFLLDWKEKMMKRLIIHFILLKKNFVTFNLTSSGHWLFKILPITFLDIKF